MKNPQHIPPGFKQSKQRPIPNDWNVESLGVFTLTFSGGTPLRSSKDNYNGDIPWIKSGELNKEIITETSEFISEEGLYSSSAKIVYPGTLLLALYGATAGISAITKIRAAINQAILAILPNKDIANEYFLLNWLKLNKERIVHKYCQGGQPNLSAEIIKTILIPLPPLPEQTAIANLLSTWDKAIETTQKLIAQKALRKKWLMQVLLTGKKRVKGFSNEWKELKIKDVFERVTRKNDEENSNVVTISAQQGFVKQDDFFKKIVASDSLENYYLAHKGEFCYNKSYSNGYPWGATKRLKEFDKAVVTTLYICFKIRNEHMYSSDFFEHFFNANLLDKGLTKIAHEGGRAHGLLNVTPGDFFDLSITIPDIDEQIIIAKIISSANNEIQFLHTKLTKLKEQKKGLMQVLLTGRKRLKLN
jgi:type I restriction enzyme S subunit